MDNQKQGTQHATMGQLQRITPLSKYLALTLFVTLPFIGGWVGYHNAPVKVVEVEVEVEKIIVSDPSLSHEGDTVVNSENISDWTFFSDETNSFNLRYLTRHTLHVVSIDRSVVADGVCVATPQAVGTENGYIFKVTINDPGDDCVRGRYSGPLSGVTLKQTELINVNGYDVLERVYMDSLPPPEQIGELVGESYSSPEDYIPYTFRTYRFEKDGEYFTLGLDAHSSDSDKQSYEHILQEFLSSFALLHVTEVVPEEELTDTENPDTNMYATGDYIELVVRIEAWEAETGGGDDVFHTITMFAENPAAGDLRFRMGGVGEEAVRCVDQDLRRGDTAYLKAVIGGIVPGWIYGVSCQDDRTSLTSM